MTFTAVRSTPTMRDIVGRQGSGLDEQRVAALEAELARARERQEALSAVLRAMATGANDVGALLATIAENAARFSGADDVTLRLLRGSGLEAAAHHGPLATTPGILPFDRTSLAARAIVERRTIHIADLEGPE